MIRLYWAGLVLFLAAPLLAGIWNSYRDPSSDTAVWLGPVIIFVCLLVLFGILAHTARKQNMLFVIRKLRARTARGRQSRSIIEDTCRLAKRAGVPAPRMYLVNRPGPSIFSVGWSRQKSSIFLNLDKLRVLDRDEFSAVIAHELAHVRRRDGLSRTVLMYGVGIFVFLAYGFVKAILHGMPNPKPNPILRAVYFVVFFVALPFVIPWVWVAGMFMKRLQAEQEYRADIEGACLIGDCGPLVRALNKLVAPPQESIRSTDGLLFLFDILGPSFDDTAFQRFFNVYPALSDRAERLVQCQQMFRRADLCSPDSL